MLFQGKVVKVFLLEIQKVLMRFGLQRAPAGMVLLFAQPPRHILGTFQNMNEVNLGPETPAHLLGPRKRRQGHVGEIRRKQDGLEFQFASLSECARITSTGQGARRITFSVTLPINA